MPRTDHGSKLPTHISVLRALKHHDRVGQAAFLKEVANGGHPRALWLRHQGKLYPMKAIWADAHRPPIMTNECSFKDARPGLTALGFADITQQTSATSGAARAELADILLEAAAYEGERATREATYIRRNASVALKAKMQRDPVCEACDFDFAEAYGELGRGYIEAHHLDPLSERDGVSKATTVDDLALLCANCHRMVHRQNPPLSIEELRGILEG